MNGDGSCGLPFVGPTEVGMSRRKNKLGKYVKSRKAKYRNTPRILFHTSPSPRKVLVPRRTGYSDGDPGCERWQPLVYLCPFNEIKDWTWWVMDKLPNAGRDRARNRFDKGEHVILYVHVVEVDPGDLHVLENRAGHEFVTGNALRPRAIVPIRYSINRPLNLARVASVAARIKKERHSKNKSSS
ncbi:MAG: hypothetical protein ACFFCS_12680 [Candidatus Hodarchaeota archaeon]